MRYLVNGGMIVMVLVALGFGLVNVRRNLVRSTLPSTVVAKEYRRFAESLETVSGKRRQLSQTPAEYFEIVRPMLGSLADQGGTLNQKFILAFYAKEGDSLATELPAEVGVFRTELKKLRKTPVGSEE